MPFSAYFVVTQAFSAVFCVIWFLFLINIRPSGALLLFAKNDPAKLGHFCRAESAPFDALCGVIGYLGAEIPVGILWVGVNAVAREGLTANRRLSYRCGLRGIPRILPRTAFAGAGHGGTAACVPYCTSGCSVQKKAAVRRSFPCFMRFPRNPQDAGSRYDRLRK